MVLAPRCGDFTRAPQLSLWETVRAFLERCQKHEGERQGRGGAPWRNQGAAGGGRAQGPAGWASSRQGCFFSHLIYMRAIPPYRKLVLPPPRPPINFQKNQSRERERKMKGCLLNVPFGNNINERIVHFSISPPGLAVTRAPVTDTDAQGSDRQVPCPARKGAGIQTQVPACLHCTSNSPGLIRLGL